MQRYDAQFVGGATALEAARRAVGFQAQYLEQAGYSLRARVSGLTRESLRVAIEEDRTLVRTWSLRGTLHLHAVEDVGWVLGLVGERAVRATASRYRALGLGEDGAARGAELVETVLADGPATRDEVEAALGREGVDTSDRQTSYHLLRRAALEGRICGGPLRDGVETWVRVADWLGELDRTPSGPEADARLAARYVAGYGSDDPDDLASWFGLPRGRCATALATAPATGDVPDLDTTTVRLIGAYDPYLLGYRGRDHVVAYDDHAQVWPGGGLLRPVVLRGGRAVATWQLQRRGYGAGTVVVTPLTSADALDEPDLAAEVEALASFLGTTLTVSVRTTS